MDILLFLNQPLQQNQPV